MLTPIIIAGSGTTPPQNAQALVQDFLTGLATANGGDLDIVVFWAFDETSNKTHVELFNWLHDPEDEDMFDLAVAVRKENLPDEIVEILSEFSEEDLHTVQRPGTKAVSLALEMMSEEKVPAEAATLIVLFDEAEESSDVTPSIDAIEEATKHGIEVRDLCAGLQTLEMVTETVEESNYPSQEDLEEMELDDLKHLASEAGLNVPKKSRSTTYRAQLNEHYRTLEATGEPTEETPEEAPEPAPERQDKVLEDAPDRVETTSLSDDGRESAKPTDIIVEVLGRVVVLDATLKELVERVEAVELKLPDAVAAKTLADLRPLLQEISEKATPKKTRTTRR